MSAALFLGLLAPLHMGKLHAYEHVIVYLLAFGPFLLLALTIWISRRRTAEDTDVSTDHAASGDSARGK